MKRFAILMLLALLALVGVVSAQEDMGPSVTVAPDGTVTIGFAAALTGEGVSAFGTDIRRGVELALEDRPTVTIEGQEYPVELDVQDSLCSPEGGQTVATRFTADEDVAGVIGPMCSAACEAALPIFEEATYTTISASCTADTLTLTPSESFNRTVARDGSQVAAVAQFLTETLGVETIAIIDDGSTYGAGLADTMEIEFAGEVVARDAVTVGDTDFRALLESINDSDPDLVYFGGFNAEGARLIEQRFDVGLEDVPFMGADGIFGPELIDLVGDAELVEGVYASAPAPVESTTLEEFAARYVETYGEEPLSAFNTNSYDATHLLLDAIEAVGYIADSGALMIPRAELQEWVRQASFTGITGELVCDGTGDCATVAIAIYQIQDEQYVQIDEIVPGAGEMDEMDEEEMGDDMEDDS